MTRDNYAALQSKIEKEISRLQKQAKMLQAKQRNPIIAGIIRSMREYDITPAELAAALNKRSSARKTPAAGAAVKKTATKAARKVPPKYRNPETGDTWTGRGKQPRWMAAALADGKTPDDFLIVKPSK